MYFATAGQQATQPPPPGARVPSAMSQQGLGQSGFPSIGGGMGRSGPPGFAGRSTDTNDFPALGSMNPSHLSHLPQNSTYASQAQPSQSSVAGQSAQHSHMQQQLYLQQMNGLAPPPPPGLSGPVSPLGNSHIGINGMSGGAVGDSREEFPALSGGIGDKDRMSNYLKLSQNSNHPPSPPPTLNGNHLPSSSTPSNPIPSLTNSGNGVSISTNGPPSTTDSWPRQSPSTRPNEPILRPVQQILSSPVDKWGLKALLYEIKTQMGKGDRGVLVFGEELSDLGIDVGSDEALYSTLVTPWVEPASIPQPVRIEESYHIPSCYQVVAPAVSTKLPNFAEDTLFYAFYASPGDLLQLEVAEELYNRGWRFHTELQMWLTSSILQTIDLPPPPSTTSSNTSSNESNYVRGPFVIFDHRSFSRQKTPDDFGVSLFDLEVTRGISEKAVASAGGVNGREGHGYAQAAR